MYKNKSHVSRQSGPRSYFSQLKTLDICDDYGVCEISEDQNGKWIAVNMGKEGAKAQKWVLNYIPRDGRISIQERTFHSLEGAREAAKKMASPNGQNPLQFQEKQAQNQRKDTRSSRQSEKLKRKPQRTQSNPPRLCGQWAMMD